LWVAPVVLIGVVAVGLAGRVAPPARIAPSAAPVAEASSPLEPVGTAQLAQRPTLRQREVGTDGLMGSLPFGIAGDAPYSRRDLTNRFTIDDTVHVQAPFRAAPPWIRRNAALTS
jgi:hypothetical protein